MFDVAPSEMLIIGLVALIAIGPKQLPGAMRQAGRWIGKMREIVGHFRAGIDEMIEQAEREESGSAFRAAKEAQIRAEALLAERQAAANAVPAASLTAVGDDRHA
jgi:sec-independent protein translocase protein TatB